MLILPDKIESFRHPTELTWRKDFAKNVWNKRVHQRAKEGRNEWQLKSNVTSHERDTS